MNKLFWVEFLDSLKAKLDKLWFVKYKVFELDPDEDIAEGDLEFLLDPNILTVKLIQSSSVVHI